MRRVLCRLSEWVSEATMRYYLDLYDVEEEESELLFAKQFKPTSLSNKSKKNKRIHAIQF